LPEEERQKRIQANGLRPTTPPEFWDIDFPTTPEYIAAGHLIVDGKEK
jgi:hypothetical protein